jgi:hypothetical protein
LSDGDGISVPIYDLGGHTFLLSLLPHAQLLEEECLEVLLGL